MGMLNEVNVRNGAQGAGSGLGGLECLTKLMYGMGPKERIWATARWQAGKGLGRLRMPNEVSVGNGAQGENLSTARGRAGGWSGWGCLTKLV